MVRVQWRTGAFWACGQALWLALACAEPVVPDPKATLDRYAAAAKRGDAAAIYAMLDERSRVTYGKAGVARLVKESQGELQRQAEALSSSKTTIKAQAEVWFVDGEVAALAIEDGVFRIEAASALPARATTPAQALAELRAVLARRSYAGLSRVLTRDARDGLERRFRSLVEGLEQPDALDVQVDGDTATVQLPGGHLVELKREAGIWRVRNFN